ncbi:hypothetical protein OH77DRAFT_1425322 [Trametes cingulata]|nr:hypothetical protein OH77DRAFT_1425322 [Trametes cingulata]
MCITVYLCISVVGIVPGSGGDCIQGSQLSVHIRSILLAFSSSSISDVCCALRQPALAWTGFHQVPLAATLTLPLDTARSLRAHRKSSLSE